MIEYRNEANSWFTALATLKAVPGMPQTYDHQGLAPGTYSYAIHTKDTSGNLTHTALTQAEFGAATQPPTDASGGGGGGGGCFIATAAYGSYLDQHVVTLRKFRDDHLLTNRPGRAFVAVYYYTAPPIADFIARHEWARKGVQLALAPVVLAVRSPMLGVLFMMMCLGALALVIASYRK
ncbi:MAG: CFI-box-CTERM domain-containing protein [Patescibacteria group bacterium]